MAYRNDTEIWVFHLQRGGGHAVCNWIARNIDRQVFYLSNAFSKPRKARWRGARIFRRLTADGGPGSRVYNMELNPSAGHREIAAMPKEVLLTNVESFRLDRISEEPLLRGEAHRLLGHSRERKTVLLLRDAFNNFASVRKSVPRVRAKLKSFYRQYWKAYAREFLGETSFLPPDTVKISYNAWFTDSDYRRQLAEQLGLPHSERGIEEVPTGGGGSSFTGRDFHQSAQKMKVLERWRDFLDDEEYLAAFDEETIELSNRIFGDVTGGFRAKT